MRLSRRSFLAVLASSPLGLASIGRAQAETFQDYKNQQQQDFKAYQSQLAADFAAYQQAQAEAFKRYQTQINAVWGDKKTGSATVLVDYNDDLTARSIVDFKQGKWIIEAVGDDSAQTKRKLSEQLQHTAGATAKDVFATSRLEQETQKAFQQRIKLGQPGKPDSKPILADVLTQQKQPNSGALSQALQQVIAKAKSSTHAGQKPNTTVYQLEIPLDPAQISDKVQQYEPAIKKYAQREQVPVPLVKAIMHTESYFNPMARSHVPAYGLMQIVPTSAGKDASEYIYGSARVLSPAYLYNADNNIQMGCAYLHLLDQRYLAAINDPQSRLYCVIAAYNTGAGNVAKAFSGNTSVPTAAKRINTMQPQAVYQHLRAHLPYQETRDYVQRVAARYKGYAHAG